MDFEMFTRMKEDFRIKSKTTLEKTGNIETQANELLRGNKLGVPAWVYARNHVQNHVQNHIQNHVRNHDQNHIQNHVQNHVHYHVRKN